MIPAYLNSNSFNSYLEDKLDSYQDDQYRGYGRRGYGKRKRSGSVMSGKNGVVKRKGRKKGRKKRRSGR